MVKGDLNSRVKEALDRTEIMALSTVDGNGSWVSPVRFTYDKSLNLYFLSLKEARHVGNILKNPQVSIAVYKDEPFKGGGNLGLQIKGSATLESVDGVWQNFKITPTEVWCFDSRISRKREEVDLQKLTLE